MAKKVKVFKSIHDKARWFSRLMKADFETLPGPEIWKMLSEYWALLYGERELGKPWNKQRLSFIGFGETDPRIILKEVQTISEKCFKQWLSFRRGDRKEMPGCRLHYTIKRDGNTVWMESVGKEGEVNLIRLEIYQLVVKSGLDAIKLCAYTECPTLFVHTTRHKKVFCSQECAWKYAHSTPELKAKKNQAQKRYYRKRMEESTGHSNLKIGGRKGDK